MNRTAARPTRSLAATGGAALFVTASAWLSAGCDNEQARADRSLQDAIAQVRAAERGFADEGQDEAAYRQQALAEALDNLEQAYEGQGGGAAAAAQLAAHIHASAANDAVARGLSAYAGLAPDAAGLVSRVAVAQVAESGASRATIDREGAIDDLQARIDEARSERSEQARVAQERQAAVSRLETQLAEQRSTASDRLAESRRLASQALGASSSQKAYELEQQAGEAELASMKASVAAEGVEADLALESARLATAQARVAQAEAAIERLTARLKAQRELGQTEQTAATEARRDRDAAVDSLTEAFDAVTEQYAQQVDAVLLKAVDHAVEAVTAAERAVSLASGSARTPAQADLVAAQITLGYAAAQRALTASMFADLVNNVTTAVKPLDDTGLGDRIARNADDNSEIASQAAATAREALEAGLAEANNINNNDSAALAERANAILGRLSDAGL